MNYATHWHSRTGRRLKGPEYRRGAVTVFQDSGGKWIATTDLHQRPDREYGTQQEAFNSEGFNAREV